jgi:hypothetical protein
MFRFKIVLKQEGQSQFVVENSDLKNFNGYLSYSNNSLRFDSITSKETVYNFLDSNENVDISNGFKNYLRENTSNISEYNDIYYKPYKLSPILNDYYDNFVKLNKSPNKNLINISLSSTTEINYYNNSFNFNDNTRNNTYNSHKLIDKSQDDSFYITIPILKNNDFIYSTDYSRYLKDDSDGDITLKQGFVNLNIEEDPFKGINYINEYNTIEDSVDTIQDIQNFQDEAVLSNITRA